MPSNKKLAEESNEKKRIMESIWEIVDYEQVFMDVSTEVFTFLR